MKTKKHILRAVSAALLIATSLPLEKLFAQNPEANPYSPTISMSLNNETTERTNRTSHDGILDPVGLRPNEQATITLYAPISWAGYPVGIAPLDGGEVFGYENLYVASGGTVSFGFKPGSTTGLHRVMVNIGGERYQLQLYLPRPADLGINCVTP